MDKHLVVNHYHVEISHARMKLNQYVVFSCIDEKLTVSLSGTKIGWFSGHASRRIQRYSPISTVWFMTMTTFAWHWIVWSLVVENPGKWWVLFIYFNWKHSQIGLVLGGQFRSYDSLGSYGQGWIIPCRCKGSELGQCRPTGGQNSWPYERTLFDTISRAGFDLPSKPIVSIAGTVSIFGRVWI